MSDHEAVLRAIELLLNSLYPSQRGEILRTLWPLYNMDAPLSTPPPLPPTPMPERWESCRRCGSMAVTSAGGFCPRCATL